MDGDDEMLVDFDRWPDFLNPLGINDFMAAGVGEPCTSLCLRVREWWEGEVDSDGDSVSLGDWELGILFEYVKVIFEGDETARGDSCADGCDSLGSSNSEGVAASLVLSLKSLEGWIGRLDSDETCWRRRPLASVWLSFCGDIVDWGLWETMSLWVDKEGCETTAWPTGNRPGIPTLSETLEHGGSASWLMLLGVAWEEGGVWTDLELSLRSEIGVCWVSIEILDDGVGELIEFKSILGDFQERMRRECCTMSNLQRVKR